MQICLNCLKKYDDNIASCPYCGFGEWKYEGKDFCLTLGDLLNDRYKIGTVIGAGGFGITYRAVDIKTGNPVAIKEYYPNGLVSRNHDHKTVQMSITEKEEVYRKGMRNFLEEAKGLAKFRNISNIVQVYDYFEQNNTAYISMEYLRGQSLSQYVKGIGGKIDERRAIEIITQISQALKAVHNVGMVHRDISPDNIFVQEDGSVILIDFGAARESYGYEDKTLSIVLKPNYAPPEQFRKKSRQGPWTDIYALGATIYRALTGVMPPESVSRIIEDELIPPSAYNNTISRNFEAILMRCMALKIDYRYQNVDLLMNDIYALKKANAAQNSRPVQNVPPAQMGMTRPNNITTYGAVNTKNQNPPVQKQNPPVSIQKQKEKTEGNKGLVGILIGLISLIVIIIIIIVCVILKDKNLEKTDNTNNSKTVTEATTETTTETTTEATDLISGILGLCIEEYGNILTVSDDIFDYTCEEIVEDAEAGYIYDPDSDVYGTQDFEHDIFDYTMIYNDTSTSKVGCVAFCDSTPTDVEKKTIVDEVTEIYGTSKSDEEAGYYVWESGDMTILVNSDSSMIYLIYMTTDYYNSKN